MRATLGAVVLLLCLSACGDGAGDPTRFEVPAGAEHLAVVPQSLPEGYGPPRQPTVRSSGADPYAVDWMYFPVDGAQEDGLPAVLLCVGMQPEHCEPAGRLVVIDRQEVDGRHVTIIPSGPSPPEAATPMWRGVALTADWRSADWTGQD